MSTFDEASVRRAGDGTFAEKPAAAESGVALDGQSVLDELDQVPAPAPGQTLRDGRLAPATFTEAYDAYFAPLRAWEAEHGEYTAESAPTPEQAMEAIGISEADLGRYRGGAVETVDGRSLFVAHTRNGGGNRECFVDGPHEPDTCTGCTMTDTIPALPGYRYDEDDDFDPTYADIYFDLPEGSDLAEREQLREPFHVRNGIETGTLPPWAVLSPRPGFAPSKDQANAIERDTYDARRRLEAAARTERETAQAIEGTTQPVRPEQRMRTVTRGTARRPKTVTERVPDGFYPASTYKTYAEAHAKASTELATEQARAAELDATDTSALPPAARDAIASARNDATTKAARLTAKADDSAYHRDRALWTLHAQHQNAQTNAAKARSDLELAANQRDVVRRHDLWRSTWPGTDAQYAALPDVP